MAYRIGVDVGGTFTDFCVLNEEDGSLHTLKVLLTPDKPGSELIGAIREIEARFDVRPSAITYFTHGTTVGVNTVIQRKGMKLALFVTEGFEDVLELGRLKTPDMYDLFSRRPASLIGRDRVFEISERLRADGSVDRPLDESSLREAAANAVASGAEGIVVAFINSYRNPEHELAAEVLLREWLPALPIFCSSKVWPVIREYERTVTAVINGYVQPRVSHYLASFQRALKEVGIDAEPFVTKSNGGIMTVEKGKDDCIQMILSGTASGVIGASYIARTCGISKCFSLDIGGTSADVAFIDEGNPQYGTGELIGEFPIYVPSVSVASIGAGGGSIAWVDPLGFLKVGPESAGSQPGPACYGRGGNRPTVTDAFAVCGLIGQSKLGYSAIQIDLERARAAIAPIANKLEMRLEAAAEAIIKVAVSGMFVEMSRMVSRLGVNPRSASLLAFGGAGPMMACAVAVELGIPEVVVPVAPGVLSAMGGLIADLKNDFIKTIYAELNPGLMEILRHEIEELTRRGLAWLREESNYRGDFEKRISLDMRYRGQSFELEVFLLEEWLERGAVEAIAAAFHAEHARLFEHSDPAAAIQVISVRFVITGKSTKPEPRRLARASDKILPDNVSRAWLSGAHVDVPHYRREALRAGHSISSPAIIAQDDSTTCIPPGFTCRVDEFGNLIITAIGSGRGTLQ